MTKLNALRSTILKLQRERRARRTTIAWVALATAVILALLAVFALDVYFDLSNGQRLLVILFAVGGVAWAWHRFTRPWQHVAESSVDVALKVERQHGIESDLVAAMQFESPEAASWGSVQLEQAVIDGVATLGSGLKLEHAEESLTLRRRIVLLLLVCGILVATTLLAPRYVGTFLNRLVLGGMHYPTQTQIRTAIINGQELDLNPRAKNQVSAPMGFPLEFLVVGNGETPEDGRVRLRSTRDGTRTEITLTTAAAQDSAVEEPVDGAREVAVDSAASSDASSSEVEYAGELARLIETVELQFYLGDAYTDPVTVEVVPLPAVSAELKITPPEYAEELAMRLTGQGLQQSVVEGSQVVLTISELDNKPLKSAIVTIIGEEPVELALHPLPGDESMSKWILDAPGTPFAHVTEPIRFEIEVVDENGLNLASPLAGHVRIQSDQPPRVLSTSMVHRVVVPTAHPILHYSLLDDYGIQQVQLGVEVGRADGTVEKQLIPLRQGEPIMADELPLDATEQINIEHWNLQPGEHILFYVQATDFRGEAPGEVVRGDGLVLEVVDEAEFYQMLSQGDLEADETFTNVIDQHTTIGD